MADGPYVLDFLQQVVDVHFGGDYACIGIDVPQQKFVSTVNSINVSFSNISGGTPGVSLYPSSFPSYPHNVTAADLAAHLLTNAGSSQMRGFAIQKLTGITFQSSQPFDAGGYTYGWELYVLMGTTPIDLTATITGHETLGPNNISEGWNADTTGRFITKNTVKTGLALPAPPLSDTCGASANFGSFVPGVAPTSSFAVNYHIDPAARKISVTGAKVTSTDKIGAYFYNGATLINV